jgi:uncharacterized small protein (DUF1192 family)
MVFDDPPPVNKPATHEVGQELGALSVFELDERIALLTAEIERLKTARARKEAGRSAADALFKL